MKRAGVIALVLIVGLPVVLCVGAVAGIWVAGNLTENVYERRTHAVVARRLQLAGANPEQIVIRESQFNNAFRTLPKVLGLNPGNARFSMNSSRIYVKGRGLLDSYLSYVFAVEVEDGRIRFVSIRPPGYETSTDTIGTSHTGLGDAVADGINRALEEAGVRATAVEARNGNLTIEVAPIAKLEQNAAVASMG